MQKLLEKSIHAKQYPQRLDTVPVQHTASERVGALNRVVQRMPQLINVITGPSDECLEIAMQDPLHLLRTYCNISEVLFGNLQDHDLGRTGERGSFR